MEGAREIDVVVVGGGISGLGIAAALGKRGLECLLLERGAFGQATSGNSLRIIHGGLRYLQELNFPRTVRSIDAQQKLLSAASAMVTSLPCLMPLSSFGTKSFIPVSIGAYLYRRLARRGRGTESPVCKIVNSKFVDDQVSAIRSRAPFGALHWEDAHITDLARFTTWASDQAVLAGAELLPNSTVRAASRSNHGWELQVVSDGALSTVCARCVVNATGPWVQEVARVFRAAGALHNAAKWCKGFNIILKHQVEKRFALGCTSTLGRLFFAVPRGDVSVIGTDYIAYEGPPEEVSISSEEVSSFLAQVNDAFPRFHLTYRDVADVEVGVLPMKRKGFWGPVLYGCESIKTEDHYLEVLSTKYTTFQSQGEDVADLVTATINAPLGAAKRARASRAD